MKKFLALSVALALVSAAAGATARSHAAVAHFMLAHPCPAGPDKGSTRHCRGWIIDHIDPLACGGADDPANMQWQTTADASAKDKWERNGCRGGRRLGGQP